MLPVSSTMGEPDATAQGPGWAASLGCMAIVMGAAAVSSGYLLLCLLVYGSHSDPFGATTWMALIAIGAGVVALVPVGLVGLTVRVWRRQWRAATVTALALGGAALLAGVGLGWLRLEIPQSEWLPPALTTLVTLAGAVAAGRAIQPFGTAALLAATVSGGLFGWGVASRLDVHVVHTTQSMRAAEAKAFLMFEASESGDYVIRVGDGGCLQGRPIAIGTYGPGWEETEAPPAIARVPLGDTGLAEGENSVSVCLRHGTATGEDRTLVVVDDTAPSVATLDVQPTTGAGGNRTAGTRTLIFSGTADPHGRASLEVNGLPLHPVPVVDGRWSFEWSFSDMLDQAAFGLVTQDGAGNTSRSAMIHVRFVGIDPPPVALAAHPGLSVECRGEPALEADRCRAWATVTLERHPELLAGATRFLLALPDRFDSCSAESRGRDGFTLVGLVVSCPEAHS